MSWKDIIKADNVGIYGHYYRDKDGNEMLDKPRSKAWYDGKETWINLSKIRDLEDFIESDLHETIHQVTISEIDNEIQEFLTEETKYLHDSPELYAVRNGTVRPKKQLYDSLKERIGNKLASHIAFTEIVTLLQSDNTNLNDYEKFVNDAFDAESLYYGYVPQFQNEMRREHYKWIFRNMIVGASNALNTEKMWGQITTDRDKDRHKRLKNRFCDEIGQMAASILIDTLAINEDWDKTIDFKDGRTETIGQAKERLKKSWEGVLKNIQISGQRTTSKDIVAPDDEDDCCELLREFVGRATDWEPDNPFGDGMVGVPTFLDTGGIVPDEDFINASRELTFDEYQKSMYKEIIEQILQNVGNDWNAEFERLGELYKETVDFILFHEDSCDKIVTVLDKWSDRQFVGWRFYEEWVNTYTTSEPERAKQRTDNDYNRYMDSYRKLWMALLQNNCADILIQKPWMRMATQG